MATQSMANGCRSCNRDFTGVGPFDMHHRIANDARMTITCLDPADLGMVQNQYGRWGTGEEMDAVYVPAAARPDADYIRECRTCGKEFMRPRGRGRPPKECNPCKTKAVK